MRKRPAGEEAGSSSLADLLGERLFCFSGCSVGGQSALGGLGDEVVGGEGEGDCLVVVFIGVVVHSVDTGGAFFESDIGEFVK